MSYLHLPRLVFTGDFYADTATVNNDVRHYDNDAFESVFQEPQQGQALYGWWNPNGGNQFNLVNCSVQQITMPNGQQSSDPSADIIIGQLVGAPDDKGTGKMLDLDPQWQMSSELWCVQIRIYTADNQLLLKGDLTTAGFRDLQMRQTDNGQENGQPNGGCWTSTLTNLEWGELASQSKFLMLLKNTTQNNTLAINLNMYGFYYNHNDGRFSLGRIIGSIGPWFANEPQTMPATRRLYGIYGGQNNPIYFNYSNFIINKDITAVTLDLGGSFPIADSMGTITNNTTQYILGISNTPLTNAPMDNATVIQPSSFTQIGQINYTGGNADWLNVTGGIVTMKLTAQQLSQLQSNQLMLIQVNGTGQYQLLARESIQGFWVRADNLVQRLDNGDTASVDLYAYQWGEPAQNVPISVSIQPPTQMLFAPQQTGDDTQNITVPYINTPPEGLTFGYIAPTDANGKTSVSITGNAIDNPRGYVEGQVYYISYQNNPPLVDSASYSMDAIYVHLRNPCTVPEAPTWDDVSEVFIQFGNVYPLMSKYVVNLNSEQAVSQKTQILIYAFTRPITDTFYMPVTRDISEAKRQTIVKWLQNPLPGTGTSSRTPSPAKAATEAATANTPLVETAQGQKVREITMRKNGAETFKSKQ